MTLFRPGLWSLCLTILLTLSSIDAICQLNSATLKAECDDLRDLKNILIHNLRGIRTFSSIETLHPGTFSNFSGLSFLDLSKGKLQRIRSGSFKELTNLVTLNLSENKLRVVEAGAFDGLEQVVSLMMRDNGLSQLPVSLLAMPNLKYLDVSGNPLSCNCASLKLRDMLSAHGMKFASKTVCQDQQPIMKPNTERICAFEDQEREQGSMQADQPEVEGSGDIPAQNEVLEPATTTVGLENESENEIVVTTVGLSASPRSSSASSVDETMTTTIAIEGSGEVDSANAIIVEGSGSSTEDTPAEATTEPVTTTTSTTTTTTTPAPIITTTTEEPTTTTTVASTTRSNGLVSTLLNFFSSTYIAGTPPTPAMTSSTTTTSTTTTSTTTTTTTTTTTEKMPDITEEHFIPVVTTLPERRPRTNLARSFEPAESPQPPDNPRTWVSKHGTYSYVVLCAILAFVVLMLGIAAYRANICGLGGGRKRRDLERGTELKDMQKSLLDANQGPKIQIAANGGKQMENVPLMTNTSLLNGHNNQNGHHQSDDRSYDIAMRNGSSNLELIDPVKPPRKITNLAEFDQLSLNGEEDIVDAASALPTSNGCNGEHHQPPGSPDAQRVKITLQELPHSVPMTPVVITRLQNGDNLVK